MGFRYFSSTGLAFVLTIGQAKVQPQRIATARFFGPGATLPVAKKYLVLQGRVDL
jgi:hypothetical protein